VSEVEQRLSCASSNQLTAALLELTNDIASFCRQHDSDIEFSFAWLA
jgi:hypothetical protein